MKPVLTDYVLQLPQRRNQKLRQNSGSRTAFYSPRRGQLGCDGTSAETRFHLSVKRTSPFKSTEASVQSTTGSRVVRISGSNVHHVPR